MAASGFTFEVFFTANAAPANIARPYLPDPSGARLPKPRGGRWTATAPPVLGSPNRRLFVGASVDP
jgi:hypothetical protein